MRQGVRLMRACAPAHVWRAHATRALSISRPHQCRASEHFTLLSSFSPSSRRRFSRRRRSTRTSARGTPHESRILPRYAPLPARRAPRRTALGRSSPHARPLCVMAPPMCVCARTCVCTRTSADVARTHARVPACMSMCAFSYASQIGYISDLYIHVRERVKVTVRGSDRLRFRFGYR
jgi:hypothetical protein